MAYKAIVSITFDDDDIKQMKEEYGSRFDLHDWVFGEMQNLSYGSGWVESIREEDDAD